MKKNKSYSNKKQIARLLIINVSTSLLSIVVLCLIASLAIFKLDLGNEIAYYVSFLIIALVGIVNGFFLAQEIKSRGWLVGVISNILPMVAMIAGHFIAGEKNFEKYFFVKIVLLIVLGMIGGVVGVNKKKKFK